jgi:hypothetical protein
MNPFLRRVLLRLLAGAAASAARARCCAIPTIAFTLDCSLPCQYCCSVFGELRMEVRFRAVMAHIRQAGLLEAPDLEYMDGVISTLVRLRDAFLPELAVLVLLIIHTAASYKGLVDPTPWLARGAGATLQLSAAGWYTVLVSAPIFQFVLGLSLWKWLLWVIFAFKFSRRNLRLFPTHPDEHGGLGFLSLTPAVFSPIAFAASTVIGATWRYDILHHGAHLKDGPLARSDSQGSLRTQPRIPRS